MSVNTLNTVASVIGDDGNPSGSSHLPASDLETAMLAVAGASPAYVLAQQYYEGTRPEVNANYRMRRAMARTSTAFHMNFAKKPVDAVTERLEITSVTSTDPAAAGLIADLWKDNKLARQSKLIMRRAGEYGDAYVIVWPSQDGDWDGDGIKNLDIFYNSPQSVRVFYDPENPMRKAFAIKEWVLSAQKRVRVNLYYADRIEKYVSRPGILHPKAADMHEYHDEDPGDPLDYESGPSWPTPNPFGQIPVFHFRNDDPYGVPEHQGFYGAQDAIRKLVLSHMAGVDYQSFPQRYALADGTDSSELAAGDEDEFAFALGTGATSRAGDPQSQLSADSGSVWWLNGVKGVGQFDSALPAIFTDPMALYLRFGAQITDTPINRIDPTGAPESGEARRIAEDPFNKKVIDRQTWYGETWTEVFDFALKLLGVEDAEVTVHWKSPTTVDDQDGWATLLLKLQSGLPPRQCFLEAGYTLDQVGTWFGDGDDDLPMQVDLLGKIGVALQALGAALGYGILDEPQAQQIVTAIMGDIIESQVAADDAGADDTAA